MNTHKVFHLALITVGTVLAPLEASADVQLASGTDSSGRLLAVGAPDPRTTYTSASDPSPTLALVGKGQPIGAYTGDMIGTGKSQTVTVDNLGDTWADFTVRFTLPSSNIYALRLDFYADDGTKVHLNGRLLGTFDQLDAQHNFATNHLEIMDQSYFVAGTNELKFHTINTFTGHYDESAIKVRSGVDGMAIQYEGSVSLAPALPTIYFVHGNLGSDTNNGLSWQTAKKTVQSALQLALYGDEIWVARGTYVPGSARTNSFAFKAGVSLYGGFTGIESSRQQRDWASNPTVLSGDLSANDNGFTGNADNAYHVVVLTNDVTVDGVLVRGGNANSASAPHCYGGGIYCVNATNVSVANCGFVYNNATEKGGAFYSENSSLAMAQSLFATNTAKRAGGLWVAAGRADLVGCTFKRCTTTGRPGGGVYFSATKLNIDRCWFLGNSSGFGGGIYGGFTSDFSLRNSVFSLNRCGGDSQGGTSTGGALWLENQVVASIVNCTLVGNSDSHGLYAVYGYDAVELAMTNCIIWSNVGQTVGGTLSTHVVLSHCDVSGAMARFGFDASSSATNAGGLLDLDPQFVVDADPLTENYGDVHLRSGSPCIDAGEDVSGLNEDLEGDPRPSNGGLSFQVDIGADEYVPPPLTLGLNSTNSGVMLAVSGPIGASVTVQYATNLANPTYWMPLSNFVLPFSPYNVPDLSATNAPQRFYRALR